MCMKKIRVKKSVYRTGIIFLEVKISALSLMSYMVLDELLNPFRYAFTCKVEMKINLCHGVKDKINEHMHARFSLW